MILNRYVMREVLQAFAGVLFVLVLVYVSNVFARYLTAAAAGSLSGGLIAELLALRLIEGLVLILPPALYVAILLGLGRLYRDSEVTAMFASGIGIGHIAKTIAWLACLFSAITLALTFYVSPRAAALQDQVLDRARREAQVTGILPGLFKSIGPGSQVIYIEELAADKRSMENVFVQVTRGGREHVLVAERAYQRVRGDERDRYMVLENGHRYTGAPGRADFAITEFATHAVRLDFATAAPGVRKVESVPTLELLGATTLVRRAELQWRLSLPVSVFLLSMLAVVLSRTSSRDGKYARLLLAVLVYFVYNNAIGIARHLIESGASPPAVGVWPVHLLMLLIVIALYVRQAGGAGRLSAWIGARAHG